MFQSVKLYHRTTYWGREIQGRHTERTRGIDERVINTQIVLENHNEFFGCCFSHGPRVAELKETHFLTHYDGPWDLYLVERKISKGAGVSFMTFCLMPDFVVPRLYWKHEGTLRPQTIRMQLAKHCVPILFANNAYGYPHNHVHVMVVMDKANCANVDGWARRPTTMRRKKIAHVPRVVADPFRGSVVLPGLLCRDVVEDKEDKVAVPGISGIKSFSTISSRNRHHPVERQMLFSPPKSKPPSNHLALPFSQEKIACVGDVPIPFEPNKAQLLLKRPKIKLKQQQKRHGGIDLSDFVSIALTKKGKQA